MKRTTALYLTAAGLAIFGISAAASFSIAGGHKGHHMGMGGPGMEHHGWHRKGHHGPHGRKGLKRLMKKFDTNGDSKLTQKEIDDSITAMHSKHDADKDGQVSLEEFQSAWLEMTRQRMVRRFQHLDSDGDAKVTLGEAKEPLKNVVEMKDRNGDGVLSKDDRKRRWGKWWKRHGGGPRGDGPGGEGRGGPRGPEGDGRPPQSDL